MSTWKGNYDKREMVSESETRRKLARGAGNARDNYGQRALKRSKRSKTEDNSPIKMTATDGGDMGKSCVIISLLSVLLLTRPD
jgi:hypothetical protein